MSNTNAPERTDLEELIEAPERIWATASPMLQWKAGDWSVEKNDLMPEMGPRMEYIRSDLATRQQAEAVGAAYLDASKKVLSMQGRAMMGSGHANASHDIAVARIADLVAERTPADATAALAAHDAGVWNGALEAGKTEFAKICEASCHTAPDEEERCNNCLLYVLDALKKGSGNG